MALDEGRLLTGRANGIAIKDGLITFDQIVEDMCSSDALGILGVDGSDIIKVALVNEKGQPPRLSHQQEDWMYLEYELDRVDERTWRLRRPPG
jgi:hypothetical protein